MIVDLARLGAWMDDQGLPPGPIVDVEALGGGSQNVILRFSRGGERYVRRHPPEHKRSNSDETMRREARVLQALVDTDVPHARLVAACGELDVLGSAFYLMESIEGANPTVALPPRYLDDVVWRRQLGLAMADGAAAIGRVDHVATGLADLGKPEGFLDRQVDRWQAQLESYGQLAGYPGPAIPGVDAVGEWLAGNVPSHWRPGLIHGDYHFANVLCALDHPGLAAIIDWELTTVGDPLVDLGWLLATWPIPGRPVVGSISVEPWDGFPTVDELRQRYAEGSDRDLGAIAWYEVLACYKLGIILEGTYARSLSGLAPTDTGARLHAATLELFERARLKLATM